VDLSLAILPVPRRKRKKKPESTDAEPAETETGVKKMFRTMSKAIRKDKTPAAPAEPEPVAEGTDKPEPAKEAPAEGGPSVNGTDAPEGKTETVPDAPAPAVAAPSQPVPTPA